MKQQHQLSALSNLRPETVAGIENVPFATLAAAFPGVTEVDYSISEVIGTGALADTEIDVSSELGLKIDSEERMVVMEKFIVAGGLIYDDDAGHCNPLEDDGNGKLYHRGRRGGQEERAEFFGALGRDSDGNKNLTNDAVINELATKVTGEMRKDRSLMATLSSLWRQHGESGKWEHVCKKIADLIHIEGWDNVMDYIARKYLGDTAWQRTDRQWHDKLGELDYMLREEEAEAAWDRALAKGEIGNPQAVLLDIYEHGGIAYSLAGAGMQCRWDTSSGAAIWVPDDCAVENIYHSVLKGLGVGQVCWFGAVGSESNPLKARYSLDSGATWEGNFLEWGQAVAALVSASGLRTAEGRQVTPAELNERVQTETLRYCKSVLDEYNRWVNGEVFGVVVYVTDRATGKRIESHDDECWGYIGRSYAEETLEQAILQKVCKLGAAMH